MASGSRLSCAGENQVGDPDISCIEDAECLDIVRFRVSEYIYVCHRSTLLKYPNSKLAKFVKPANDKRKSGSDMIVVDRNGKLFGVVLRLMRDSTDKCWEDLKESEMDDLIEELDFFRLNNLKKFLKTSELRSNCKLIKLFYRDRAYKFYLPTIVITSRSLKAFGDDWKSMSENLISSGKFALYLSDSGCHGTMVSNQEPEVFRFFLPKNSHEDEQNSLPILTSNEKDKTYGDLIYTTKSGPSKDNFLKFIIAVDVFLKSMLPEDLLALEKRIPEVKLKRHPKNPNAS